MLSLSKVVKFSFEMCRQLFVLLLCIALYLTKGNVKVWLLATICLPNTSVTGGGSNIQCFCLMCWHSLKCGSSKHFPCNISKFVTELDKHNERSALWLTPSNAAASNCMQHLLHIFMQQTFTISFQLHERPSISLEIC